jgi:hypothetical protein
MRLNAGQCNIVGCLYWEAYQVRCKEEQDAHVGDDQKACGRAIGCLKTLTGAHVTRWLDPAENDLVAVQRALCCASFQRIDIRSLQYGIGARSTNRDCCTR